MQPEQNNKRDFVDDLRGLHWYEKIEDKTYVPPSTKACSQFLSSALQNLLCSVVPSCQAQLSALPVARRVAGAGHKLLLPWTDGSRYPFAFRTGTGSMKKAMLVKLLTYLLQHGPEHATWMQPGAPMARDSDASFYGLLEVRIPKAKVEAFSSLCGGLPLRRCWTVDRAGLKRKTVTNAWHTGGFEEQDWGDCGARLMFRPERLQRMLDRTHRCREKRVERLQLAQELEGEKAVLPRQGVTTFKRIRTMILDGYHSRKAAISEEDIGEEVEVLLTSADVERQQQENDVIVTGGARRG